MDEKRKHPRRGFVDLPVAVRQEGGATTPGLGIDISQGGMYVRTSATFPFSSEIIITLELPDLGPTDLPAFVRWTKPDGFGVQFGLLGARVTHAIGIIVSA